MKGNDALKQLIEQNAPCYVYDKDMIARRCETLASAMPNASFLYSVKTNPFAPIVREVALHGYGADAASAEEVIKAGNAGISGDMIYYSAPGKTLRDIEKVWGRCTIIADSLSELGMLERYAAAHAGGKTQEQADADASGSEADASVCTCKKVKVGVRVNPDFGMGGGAASSSKFGIDESQLMKAGLNYEHIQVVGVHVHLRSQVLDAATLCRYYEDCYAMAERINGLDAVHMEFINFGSGIGTVYDASKDSELEIGRIAQTIEKLACAGSLGADVKLILETGRFIVCNAGTYYTRIVDKKVSQGKTYLVVQNALNGFLRPAIAELLKQNLGEFPATGQEPLYTSPTQCQFDIMTTYGCEAGETDAGAGKAGSSTEAIGADATAAEGEIAGTEIVDIVGNLCTALDVMARGVELPCAQIGDIVSVSNAGSYGCTLSPLAFSSQEQPKELMWE